MISEYLKVVIDVNWLKIFLHRVVGSGMPRGSRKTNEEKRKLDASVEILCLLDADHCISDGHFEIGGTQAEP